MLWLVYESIKRSPRSAELAKRNKGYYFGILSLGASTIVAAAVSLGAFVNAGLALGLGTVALWIYIVSRFVPRLKLLKNAEIGIFNPTPLYLTCIPVVVALFQFVLVGPAIVFSRDYAIRRSEHLIRDIEEYRDAHGHYPTSLLSAWNDYKPSVIGIKQFPYEPNGSACNLYFEQFTSKLGTGEIVMYNRLDEHVMISHNMDILEWTPEELRRRRGYYAVHDTSIPHWKYFWFD